MAILFNIFIYFMLKLIMVIGSISCKNNLILAPMASVTDLGLKTLAIEYGADYAVSEMVSAKGLYYNSKNTYDLLRLADNESIKVVQLFGHEPDIFAKVVKYNTETGEVIEGYNYRPCCINIKTGEVTPIPDLEIVVPYWYVN